MQFAHPNGTILERDVPALERLDPIEVDGELCQPLTHDSRWAWYDGPGGERVFWREDKDHPDELELDGQVYARRKREGYTGHVLTSPVHEVGATKGLPVSHSLPRRRGGQIESMYGHTVRVHKDGGVTDMKGRPIVDSKTADVREQSRTGMVRIEQDRS